MDVRLVNVGFGNLVAANRFVAVVSPESAPIKRLIADAREAGRLVDATCGRRTRAVLVIDSGHVILSAVQPETVRQRLGGRGALIVEAAPAGEQEDPTLDSQTLRE